MAQRPTAAGVTMSPLLDRAHGKPHPLRQNSAPGSASRRLQSVPGAAWSCRSLFPVVVVSPVWDGHAELIQGVPHLAHRHLARAVISGPQRLPGRLSGEAEGAAAPCPIEQAGVPLVGLALFYYRATFTAPMRLPSRLVVGRLADSWIITEAHIALTLYRRSPGWLLFNSANAKAFSQPSRVAGNRATGLKPPSRKCGSSSFLRRICSASALYTKTLSPQYVGQSG